MVANDGMIRGDARRWRVLVLTLLLAMVAAACGGGAEETDEAAGDTAGTEPAAADEAEAPDDAATAEEATGEEATGEPINVGVITSTSGPLGSYGSQYVEGFEAGIECATDGTGAVNGRPIEWEVNDDTGDPARATSIATDLIGQGTTILAGTVVSGVALQVAPLAEQNDILYISGPAAADAITGINRNTFRSGRQTTQDVLTAATFLDDVEGRTVTVFAQDTAFGQANVDAVSAILGDRGATVDSILVPGETTDFTPFAARAAEGASDLLFVAWAGETASAMWQSLGQQGVFDATTVVTGLDQRATYDTVFGDVTGEIDFLSHYFAEAPDTEANQCLADNSASTPDLFHPDGYVAAQMIVHALSEAEGPEDVEGMITALEGWSFDAPKGPQTVRADDHAMVQPMFQAELTEEGDTVVPSLVETVDAQEVAPEPVSLGAEG